MSKEDQFRKLLQKFYTKVNTSSHADVYKKILIDRLNEVEVEPIHIITLTQQPSFKEVDTFKKTQSTKKGEYLYKNFDFASVFLFAFLLHLLTHQDVSAINEIYARVNQNLQYFYQNIQSEDRLRYQIFFKGLFQFCTTVIVKGYKVTQIQKLLKSFYNSSIERKGLKKAERQRYGTQAQTILSFILGNKGYFPSKKEVTDHTSDPYELNNLNFCINIQNISEREEWTVGEGENLINIVKEKNGEFSITEQDIQQTETLDQQNLSPEWLEILQQSVKIKQQQSSKTSKLFTQLNITIQCASPTKSMRSPKSANYNNLRKARNNFL